MKFSRSIDFVKCSQNLLLGKNTLLLTNEQQQQKTHENLQIKKEIKCCDANLQCYNANLQRSHFVKFHNLSVLFVNTLVLRSTKYFTLQYSNPKSLKLIQKHSKDQEKLRFGY